ncbi:hypothetical protein [Planomicrobium sp. YIM 101495]|uniref:hypothetical protein n=1 Tax=Planomicrobium sp. YIM 101495 TaxID=2665160 RepID=UPI0018AAB64F|nr:hypothetical protein [Planomicrobium sp. YIM 101495]
MNNLLFEFRFEGSENESVLEEVTGHLKRGVWEAESKEAGFTTEEWGRTGILGFLSASYGRFGSFLQSGWSRVETACGDRRKF